MKKNLASLYEQILLSEADKNSLQDTNNKVGTGTIAGGNKTIFTTVPDPKKETPEKNKDSKVDAPKELKHDTTDPEEDVTATSKESNKPGLKAPGEASDAKVGKPQTLGDSVQLSAFENLFKKILVTEEGDETPEVSSEGGFEAGSEAPEEGELTDETNEENVEEEEGDLLTDLQDLQGRIADIITKLEKAVEDTEVETTEDEGYSDDDFEQEFGGEEEGGEESDETHNESLEVLPTSKGATLQKKANKVGGKIKAKGGKANTGKYPKPSELKALGDKKKALQKGTTVSSSVKGDLFK